MFECVSLHREAKTHTVPGRSGLWGSEGRWVMGSEDTERRRGEGQRGTRMGYRGLV